MNQPQQPEPRRSGFGVIVFAILFVAAFGAVILLAVRSRG